MPLVTVEEVVAYMNDPSFNPSQEAMVETTIAGVQEELEIYLGRPVEPVQMREMIEANGDGLGFVSVNPVQEILSIGSYSGSSFTPTAITAPDMTETDATRVIDKMPSHTAAIPGGLRGLQPFKTYVVEYIGGYRGYADNAMRIAILEVTARSLTLHHDDSISLLDQPPTPQSALRGGGLSPKWEQDELDKFKRLKRRVIM